MQERVALAATLNDSSEALQKWKNCVESIKKGLPSVLPPPHYTSIKPVLRKLLQTDINVLLAEKNLLKPSDQRIQLAGTSFCT